MIFLPAFLITSSIVYLHHFSKFDAVSIDNEYKGKQALFIEAKADTLTQLVGLPRFRAPRHPIRLKVSVFPMPD